MHGCVGPHRPIDAEKKGQAEVSREPAAGFEFPESPDIGKAAPLFGHAEYAERGFCVDIGWMKIPKRKSFRAKEVGVLPYLAAAIGYGGSFACLSGAGILDAQETEQDGAEESPQRIESLRVEKSKLRKRQTRRQHAGATKAIQHRHAPEAKASVGLLLLDQTPAGAPSSWADSNGRGKLWRIMGGEGTSLVTFVPTYRLVRSIPPEGTRGCSISRRSHPIR